jgi:hypothetical protein
VAKYSTAYSDFSNGLKEVRVLRVAASKLERADPVGERQRIDALCRGSIVLLSAHLEGYVKSLGEVLLDRVHALALCRSKIPRDAFFYHLSKDFISSIKETKEPDAIAALVFGFIARDGSLWGKLGPFPNAVDVVRFNKGFSNPKFDKIVAYLGRFGYQTYKRDMAALLRADFVMCTNAVDHLVDTRNKVAHGDASASKTPSEVEDLMGLVRKLARGTDQMFCNWCSASLCKIR